MTSRFQSFRLRERWRARFQRSRRLDRILALESSTAMPSFILLTGALYAEEVARARAMDPGDKLLEGPRLFARACRIMADGVRHRHPELNERDVLARVQEQLNRLDTLEPS